MLRLPDAMPHRCARSSVSMVNCSVAKSSPKFSHSDEVSISVIDCFGTTHIMRPQLKSLRNEDGDYFIPHRDNEVSLLFKGLERTLNLLGEGAHVEKYLLPCLKAENYSCSKAPTASGRRRWQPRSQST